MNTITIDLNELRTLLSRVIPFAQQVKHGLPVLETIHLTGKGDYLVATATDRYIVGIARTKVENAADFQALVKLQDVKHILSTFKSRKYINTKITLTTSGEAGNASLTVALADGLFADADDLTARYGLHDGTFPEVGKIFREWTAPTEFSGTGYNAAYLAKFAHVTNGREPIKFSGGGLRPTIIQAGDFFLGAIMPVRLDGAVIPELGEWVKAIAKPATAKVAAPVKKAAAKKAAPARKRAAAKVA